ncbi:hypothetical protein [Cetobacterium sp.]|uniref:hypothetical protein n=1 Tax=Cetobacterium sp. TaxID=2071632 RepID=UPI003F663343
MEKTNYDILKEYAEKYGYTYNSVSYIKINKLSEYQLQKIKKAIKNGDYIDLKIRLGNIYYMLEITPMNDTKELDIVWSTLKEYNKARGI